MYKYITSMTNGLLLFNKKKKISIWRIADDAMFWNISVGHPHPPPAEWFTKNRIFDTHPKCQRVESVH